MIDYKLKAFVIATLRKSSYRYPARNEALKNARVERNQYKCAMCGMIYTRKEVQIDHIKPIVDPAVGFTTWDDYITNLYCGVEGFQVLDKTCHKIKTDSERAIKKALRPKKTKKSSKKASKRK